MDNIPNLLKPTVAVVTGMASAVAESVVPMFMLTGAFVVADVVTAWRLQRRLAAAGKLSPNTVRFSSARLGRVFTTLTKIMCLLVLTAMTDHLILGPLGMPAIKIVAGAVCFWQAISLLENEAAENNAPWAIHARRFLIDKAKRYLATELNGISPRGKHAASNTEASDEVSSDK